MAVSAFSTTTIAKKRGGKAGKGAGGGGGGAMMGSFVAEGHLEGKKEIEDATRRKN